MTHHFSSFTQMPAPVSGGPRTDSRERRLGVLLVALGTPEGTGYWDIRRYLSEFLSDRRVIEVNPLIWQPFLQGVILSTRPRKTAAAYRAIWRDDADGSPLRHFTRLQAETVQAELASDGDITVDWAVRYGRPSIEERLHALKDQGCGRIVVVPLYPQYSATTTATVMDAVFRALMRMRWQPSIRSVPSFCDHPLYIQAIAGSIRQRIRTLGWQPDLIVASFHGLPERYIKAGDPYHAECSRTVSALRAALGPSLPGVMMTFQSRFGRAPWLRPYTEETIVRLAQRGIRNILTVTPGFVTDCVETLEEIAIGVREAFVHAGGEEFDHVPCLNDSQAGTDLLATLARQELTGWLGDRTG
jgi:protoporphyrin/coproporphyrin ferrochelatase